MHWDALRQGMPNVAVLGLNLITGADLLRAATHGRGVFDLANLTTITALATDRRSASLGAKKP